MTKFMNYYTWHPMSEPPTRTGTYLVGHRGHQEVHHYFASDKGWCEGTKLGWQDELLFAPTHWMGFMVPDSTGKSYSERMAMIDEQGRPRYGILQ